MVRQRVREWTEKQTPALAAGGFMLTAYAIALPLWWALPPIEFFANGRGVMPLVPLLACLLVAVPITHWLWSPVMDSVTLDESEHTKR